MSPRRNLPMYVSPSLCEPCGGRCCKTFPGITSPEDWGAPDRKLMVRRLVKALRSGKYAIDWWEGILPGTKAQSPEFVRPAVVGHEGEIRHGGHGDSTCSLLTPSGCSLEHDARPFGCRDLKPGWKNDDVHCMSASRSSKRREVARWIAYQETLHAVVRRIQQTRTIFPLEALFGAIVGD